MVIRNNLIPFKGYAAINLFGIIFVRKDVHVSNRLINHEKIHTRQMLEYLVIGFYLLYILEYLFNILRFGFYHDMAYRNISFEREAYWREHDMDYLKYRPLWNNYRMK